MRIEATKAANETKVWLTDTEIEQLRRATAWYRDDVIIQLGAYVGLRAFEIPQATPSGILTTDSGQFRFRVPRGKDTTGNGGKPRDAFFPRLWSGRYSSTRTPRISRRASRSSS